MNLFPELRNMALIRFRPIPVWSKVVLLLASATHAHSLLQTGVYILYSQPCKKQVLQVDTDDPHVSSHRNALPANGWSAEGIYNSIIVENRAQIGQIVAK